VENPHKQYPLVSGDQNEVLAIHTNTPIQASIYNQILVICHISALINVMHYGRGIESYTTTKDTHYLPMDKFPI
jgi:hypothetical protein